MQKAEAQHKHAQSLPAQRQGRGASLESSQGEQIAQLEAMAEASPQVNKLAQLAVMANNSPQAVAQRRMVGAIHSSPNMTAQRKQLDSLTGEAVQREEAEEPLQTKVAQREATPAKPNNTGLPDNLKNGIESLSGMSMDNVKVHYNSSQPAQLNALAYAQGTDIHVAPGQEQHLPHEAWHVVQQAQGRVQPTMQMKEGVPVNDDKALEHEADVMGGRAADGNVQSWTIQSGLDAGVAVAQLRVPSPEGLDAAPANQIDGVRKLLLQTLNHIKTKKPDQTDFFRDDLKVNSSDLKGAVDGYSITQLADAIRTVIAKYPDQQFDSSKFDVLPSTVDEKKEMKSLVDETYTRMGTTAGKTDVLKGVFGDGDVSSSASGTAATTARDKLVTAGTGLLSNSNIYMDTSGIPGQIGMGGYAIFNNKILLNDLKKMSKDRAVTTLAHESMHYAHSEIRDAAGYASSGTPFCEAQIPAKLKNADHYAEAVDHSHGIGVNLLPFKPATSSGSGGRAKTTSSDDDNTMDVRARVKDLGRRLWTGALRIFLGAVDNKKKDPWFEGKEKTGQSQNLGMTYHLRNTWKDSSFTEVDLALGESFMNRIKLFNGALRAKMDSTAPEDYQVVKGAYDTAGGLADEKVNGAANSIVRAEGTSSAILEPQDKLPSVKERFDSMIAKGG